MSEKLSPEAEAEKNKAEFKKIDNIIELFNGYQEEVKKQRLRGLNDFNVFTILFPAHKEVKLHSKFLAYLLNPHEDHYQEELFLQLFLDICGWHDFFPNPKHCSVYREHKNIDIYITDGSKHIIIENKIRAGDQYAQIKRYINEIKKETNNPDDIRVIYLSIGRGRPSDYSLYKNENDKKNGYKWKREENKDEYLIAVKNGIVQEEEKYQCKSIHYKEEIKNWLKNAYEEVVNINNLSLGIKQYIEVIEKLIGEYKEKIMNLAKYLKSKYDKNKGSFSENIKTMEKISTEYPAMKERYMTEFWEEVENQFNAQQIEGSEELKIGKMVISEDKRLQKGFRIYTPLRIRLSDDSKLVFAFEYSEDNHMKPIYGIIADIKVGGEEQIKIASTLKKPLKKLLENKTLDCDNDWWIRYGNYLEENGSFFEKVISEGNIKKSAKEFLDKFLKVFNEYKDVLVEGDKILKDIEKDIEIKATEFWNEVKEQFEAKKKGNEELILDKERLEKGFCFYTPLRISLSDDSKLVFAFEYSEVNHMKPIYGIIADIKVGGQEQKKIASTLKEPLKNKLLENKTLDRDSVWWLRYGNFLEENGSFIEEVINKEDIKKSAEDFLKKFLEVFEEYKEVLVEGDKILKNS